eukprot:Colp12_sorted_trinity150504_noHs@30628
MMQSTDSFDDDRQESLQSKLVDTVVSEELRTIMLDTDAIKKGDMEEQETLPLKTDSTTRLDDRRRSSTSQTPFTPRSTRITVDNPIKHESYTSYAVTTEAGGKNISVRRRYSDFAWLHHELQQEAPGVLLPVCPRSNYIRCIHYEQKYNLFARSLLYYITMRCIKLRCCTFGGHTSYR